MLKPKLESGEEKSNQNLTYMIIFMFINYLIGNLPYAFIFILTHLISTNSMTYVTFRFIANLILFSHIIVISFIYYNFNKAYNQLFNSIILRRGSSVSSPSSSSTTNGTTTSRLAERERQRAKKTKQDKTKQKN